MPRLLAIAGALLLLVLALLPFLGGPPAPADRAAPAQQNPTRTAFELGDLPAFEPMPDAGTRERANAAADQGISGRIVDGAQRPVGGALVAAVLRPAFDPVTAAAQTQRGIRIAPLVTATTAADGTFALAIAAADVTTTSDSGRFELHALADGFGPAAQKHLAVAPGAWLRLGDVELPAGLEVRGVVRDQATEQPLADAVVTVTTADLRTLRLPGREDGLGARTDTDGRYVVRGLAPGPFAIAATAPQHARVELQGQLATPDEPNELDFALPAGVTLQGVVVSEDGRGIADAFVSAGVDALPTAITARTRSDGTFALEGLPAGTVRLSAAAVGCTAVALDGVSTDGPPVRIVLAQLGGIRVRARAADGQPLLRFVAAARGAGDPAAALRRAGPFAAAPDRLQDGALLLPGLDAGDYAVEVEAPGHARTIAPPCTVRDREVTAVEVTLRRGGTLRGYVVAPDGTALAGARVATVPPEVRGGDLGAAVDALVGAPITRASVRTDTAGAFAFEHLAAGDYRLHVEHARFAPRAVTGIAVADEATRDVGAIALRAGATVAGHALVAGAPEPTVVVELLALDGELPPGSVLETGVDRDGAFRFDAQLPEGHYALLAGRRVRGNPVLEHADRAQSRVEIDLRGGERRTVELQIKGP